jgi:hypothetical protein
MPLRDGNVLHHSRWINSEHFRWVPSLAIIQPSKVGAVRQALKETGVEGIAIAEARGTDGRRDTPRFYYVSGGIRIRNADRGIPAL